MLYFIYKNNYHCYFYQIESLQEDFYYLRKVLNLPDLFDQTKLHYYNLKKHNKTATSAESARHKYSIDESKNIRELFMINESSSGHKFTYDYFMSQLTQLEIDLLYTAYYQDFIMFGYD